MRGRGCFETCPPLRARRFGTALRMAGLEPRCRMKRQYSSVGSLTKARNSTSLRHALAI